MKKANFEKKNWKKNIEKKIKWKDRICATHPGDAIHEHDALTEAGHLCP